MNVKRWWRSGGGRVRTECNCVLVPVDGGDLLITAADMIDGPKQRLQGNTCSKGRRFFRIKHQGCNFLPLTAAEPPPGLVKALNLKPEPVENRKWLVELGPLRAGSGHNPLMPHCRGAGCPRGAAPLSGRRRRDETRLLRWTGGLGQF